MQEYCYGYSWAYMHIKYRDLVLLLRVMETSPIQIDEF